MANIKTKPTLPNVAEWEALSTAGDIKRLIKWTVCALLNGKLDTRTAGTLSALANTLLGALRDDDTENKLKKLEAIVSHYEHAKHQQTANGMH